MADANHTPPMAAAPPTAAILSTHERIEVESLGIEVLIPAAYARMLRRTGRPLHINVALDPEPSALPPLTSEQQAVLAYLREHGLSPASELSKHTGFTENTIKRWCSPNGPLRAYGVTPSARGYAVSE